MTANTHDRLLMSVVATGAILVVANAHASCAPPSYETLVRGRFVRCESALLHTEAAGGDLVHLERMYDQEPEAFERLRRGVVVVLVDRQVRIDPWNRGDGNVVLQDAPHEVDEYVRYWWSGPAATAVCERTEEGATLDLWITLPCCDTLPATHSCLVKMNYAEPAPEALQVALASALGPLSR